MDRGKNWWINKLKSRRATIGDTRIAGADAKRTGSEGASDSRTATATERIAKLKREAKQREQNREYTGIKNFIGAIWNGIILLTRGVNGVASYLAGWSDVITNDMVRTIVYWIAFTVVVVAALVLLGFVIVKVIVKIAELKIE